MVSPTTPEAAAAMTISYGETGKYWNDLHHGFDLILSQHSRHPGTFASAVHIIHGGLC
jgi:hypothetical protein